MLERYFIGVVSKDHVEIQKIDGFAQVCHGKKAPLARLSAGDYLIFYSPTKKFHRFFRNCKSYGSKP